MISKAPPGIDMRPEAIDRRFRTLSELYQFATTVKDVKWLGKARDLDARRSGDDHGEPTRKTRREGRG